MSAKSFLGAGIRMLFFKVCVLVAWILPAGYVAAQPVDPVAIAHQHLTQAIANQNNHVAGWGADLRAVATELSRLGLYSDAIGAVDLLVANPENAFDTMTGMMMRGDFLAASGETGAALAQFLYTIDTCNASLTLRGYFPDLYAAAYAQCAMLQFENGHTADAMTMVDSLLTGTPNYLPTDLRETMLCNKVAIAEATANNDAITSAVDALFSLTPSYGKTDGKFIALLLAKYRALDNGSFQDSFLANLVSLWNNPECMAFPQSLAVGETLATVHMQRGRTDLSLDVTAVALGRLDAHKVAWLLLNNPAFDANWADEQEVALLGHLQGGDQYGRPWLSLWANFRLASRSDLSDDQISYLVDHYKQVNAAIVADDPSKPANGLGIFPDSSGQVHPELATVLTSDFSEDAQVPIIITSAGPLRFNASTNWTTGFTVYAGSDDTLSWTPVTTFVVRAPSDSSVNDPASLGISRAPGQSISPGIYAVVPKAGIRYDLDGSVPLANCPHVQWSSGLVSGPNSPYGAYYFRVGSDCDAESTNDLLQIVTGRASTPVVELDHNNNGVLDSCELGNPCRADFDGNHQIAVQDIFAFLSAWFDLRPSADADLNGQLDVTDIFAFLNIWFSYNPQNPC